MNYDVFVSYSMNCSSSAYELSAQLDRVNLRCYLDCVESGYALGDYARTILEECGVFVVLGDKLPTSAYGTALLQCVTGMVKPVLLCLADGALLPDALRERCSVTTEASLLEDILSLLGADEAADEVAEEHCPNSPSAYRGSTAESGGSSRQNAEFGDERNEAEPNGAEGGTDAAPEEFAPFDWQPLSSSADPAPIFTVTPVCEDDTDGEQDDTYEGGWGCPLIPGDDTPEEQDEQDEPVCTERRGDLSEFYEEAENGHSKYADESLSELLRKALKRLDSGWVGLALYFLIVFLLVKACA